MAIENKETETVANAIFVHWICRYGVPIEIVTDQGKEFVSHVCQALWNKLELIHNTTSPRHPQANSQAEVVNRSIIRYLASFVDDTTLDWECFLAPLMFSYNTTFHRSLKTSPFFMTFGVHPRIPQEIVRPQYGSDLPTEIMQRLQVARNVARSFMDKAALEYKEQHDKNAKQRDFVVNQQVLLDEHSFLNKNQKLCAKFSGPHIITRLKGPVDVELLLNNGRRVVVHVNRIKPFKDGIPPGEGVSSQNRGGIVDDFEDTSERPTRAQERRGPDARRMTRSKTKELGLVFDSDTLKFSQPNALQAIGSRSKPKKRRKNFKPKTKQVMSHYILREVDSDEEWNVTPNWGDQVKMEVESEVNDEDNDEEFMDVSEGEQPKEEKPDTEIKIEPLPIEPQSPTKAVTFYPIVQKVNYDPDAELQRQLKSTKKADEYLRVARAAVEKVKEELQDVRTTRQSTGDINDDGLGRRTSTPSVGTGKTGTGRTSDGRAEEHPGDTPQFYSGTLTPTKYRKGNQGTTRGKRDDATGPAMAQGSGGVPAVTRVPHDEGAGRPVQGNGSGRRPADTDNAVFGQTTFGNTYSGIPGISRSIYAAATGLGTASATTATPATDESLGRDDDVPGVSAPTGWTFGSFGAGKLPTFGDLSNPSKGRDDTGTGTVPKAQPTRETSGSTSGDGRDGDVRDGRTPTRVDSRKHQEEGGSRSRSEGPITRRQKEIRGKFGLYPWYPAPEGQNDAFYVEMLAQKWCEDRALLRQRVIDGNPPSQDAFEEQRKRYDFIAREAKRTKCKLPRLFTPV